MKYCEEYAALLDLFVDGELAPEDMKRVGDHLTGCPGCQAYVDDALAIRACFPDAEETVVPEGFAGGVMERVREASGRERKIVEMKRRGVRRWLGTAAVLAACCALVVLVRTGPGEGEQAAGPAGEALEETVAYDNRMAGAAEGEEIGIAPQMAAAPAEAPAETPEAAEACPTVKSRGVEPYSGDGAVLSAAPKAVTDEGQAYEIDSEKAAALYLTEEKAGDLLDGFAAEREDAAGRYYELNAEEYGALLEALGYQEKLPETVEGTFLVVITAAEE